MLTCDCDQDFSEIISRAADSVSVRDFYRTVKVVESRSQFVDFDGEFSSEKFVSCGVPQGSILGQLLFLN